MTARFEHGLVIGKFYPPHAGHHLLIRAASQQAKRVTVVVMAAAVESLRREDREAWVREANAEDTNVTVTSIDDDNPVDLESDAIWQAHVELMQQAVAKVTALPVDAVFTSEAYGEELGRRLGASHVVVDQSRQAKPISGTAIRANPARHWDALSPGVRAHLAMRIVLVGAESTGKTTLAELLASRLRARGGAFAAAKWVPEVGREVSLAKLQALKAAAAFEEVVWTTPDFVTIAAAQGAREAQLARDCGPVLICDTDAFATGVWHERYMHARSPEVEALGAAAPWHLYLLTHPDDVPFVQDGLRTDDGVRHAMTDTFAARLDERGYRWAWLRGDREVRNEAAIQLIDARLAEGWALAEPLG